MCKRIALPILIAVLIPSSASALQIKDLLSLVTMPLAVAAVSDLAGVPQQDLVNVVSTLNQANVPPPQFVEIVRYVPVALVDDTTAPQFVEFVDTQANQGLTGDALAMAIADRLRTYGASDIDVVAPRFIPVTIVEQPVVPQPIIQQPIVQQPIVQQQPVVVQQPQPVVVQSQSQFIPRVVTQRVEEVRVRHEHPHGGPPGQLKKIEGLQTGAQIVHREEVRPVVIERREVAHENGNGHGRGHEQHVVIAQPPVVIAPAPVAAPVVIQQEHGNGHGQGEEHGEGHGKGKHE